MRAALAGVMLALSGCAADSAWCTLGIRRDVTVVAVGDRVVFRRERADATWPFGGPQDAWCQQWGQGTDVPGAGEPSPLRKDGDDAWCPRAGRYAPCGGR